MHQSWATAAKEALHSFRLHPLVFRWDLNSEHDWVMGDGSVWQPEVCDAEKKGGNKSNKPAYCGSTRCAETCRFVEQFSQAQYLANWVCKNRINTHNSVFPVYRGKIHLFHSCMERVLNWFHFFTNKEPRPEGTLQKFRFRTITESEVWVS